MLRNTPYNICITDNMSERIYIYIYQDNFCVSDEKKTNSNQLKQKRMYQFVQLKIKFEQISVIGQSPTHQYGWMDGYEG